MPFTTEQFFDVFRRYNLTNRVNNPEGPELDLLDDHIVDEIMSRPLVMLSPRDHVLDATLMEQRPSIA